MLYRLSGEKKTVSVKQVCHYKHLLFTFEFLLCETVSFTSVIFPSLHKEYRASIRSASRLFLSSCKSLKNDTKLCELR